MRRRFVAGAAGLLLAVDGLALIAQRILSLGATLPLMLGGALLAYALASPRIEAWLHRSRMRERGWKVLWLVFWAWLASLAAFFVALQAGMARMPQAGAAPAAIVVLGSGTPGGKVSALLAERLDAALTRSRVHPQAVVVVSGGRDPGERASEADLMAAYLLERGLPPQRLVREDRSASTEENLVFSRPLLLARGVDVAQVPVELVTSDFHTLRASRIAAKAGYGQVRSIGAPTPLFIRYNAWLREYFAFASGFVLREF